MIYLITTAIVLLLLSALVSYKSLKIILFLTGVVLLIFTLYKSTQENYDVDCKSLNCINNSQPILPVGLDGKTPILFDYGVKDNRFPYNGFAKICDINSQSLDLIGPILDVVKDPIAALLNDIFPQISFKPIPELNIELM